MTEEAQRTAKIQIREATVSDILLLAVHYRKMFEEIWAKKGETIDSSLSVEIVSAYVRKLRQQLPEGTCKAWVVEEDHHIIASGAISFVSFVPTPADLSSTVGYLHSMYTEKEHRNNQCAERIVKQAVALCRTMGIKRILLNASEAGRPIYEKIGFQLATDVMRLLLE
jgi:N-acetylglutamate synthase-like GNAT family acetyltransferase